MKKIVIPTISKQEFDRRLRARKLENTQVIQNIETIIKKERGYIFRMPKPGTPVILLVSGGLDSTITWGLLLAKYRLRVYPLFLHRGEKRKEKERKAVLFFSDLFRRRYPKLFVEPFELTTHLPPPELERPIYNPASYFHPHHILENLDPRSGTSTLLFARGVLPYTFPLYGVSYASHLSMSQDINIRTILSAVAPGDGTVVTSQTYTALRSTILSICVATGDFGWQFASFAFEKELGHWLEKADLIRLGANLRLPLEKTWSCYLAGRYQCGNRCLTCFSRRTEFQKAGIQDATVYSPSAVGWRQFLTNRLPLLYAGFRRLISKV